MNILILLVLLGPGLAVAQNEEDVQCASEGGVCQYNDDTCDGTYVVGKCGGPVNRQCCVLSLEVDSSGTTTHPFDPPDQETPHGLKFDITTRATPPFDPPDQETPHGLKFLITSRVTKHPLDPSDQDTTPPKTSSFFMDFLLTSRHVDHEESTTKEPKTKHHRWPTINDTLNPTSSIGPPDTTSKPPIKYTSDLSTPGKCEQRGECNDIGEKCMDKKNPKMHCNGKYYPDMCPRSKNCQCCILCNQNETCSTIGGECQYTGEGCKRGMYIINKCPGKDHCRCCAPCQQSINCTESNGTCQYTGEECRGTYVEKQCPGPGHCQCCRRCKQYSKKCSSRGGKCQYSGDKCDGGYVKGKCPGGDNCQCCLPCQQSINCTESNGTCQYTGEECRGTYVEKQCPGPGHCQCCRPCQEYSEKCSSVGGKCQYTGDKCDGISVKEFCSGVNCQCCVPKWEPFCHGDVENGVRGCEGKFWCGRYRSHRPHGKHMGVDIICPDGSRVNAPFKGELKGWVRAYKKNNAINDGVMLSNSVFCIKILYIHADRYTGPVDIGQKIGYLLNVQRVYPGITSHIHIEMCDKSKDPTFFLK
ncbi:unnamed protein product [Lampetra fluviatilis]